MSVRGKIVCVKCSLFAFAGLANILECQAILQPTFFLCLNCAEKVSRENFCHHMTSERHIHLTIVSAKMCMYTLGCIQSHRLHQYLKIKIICGKGFYYLDQFINSVFKKSSPWGESVFEYEMLTVLT